MSLYLYSENAVGELRHLPHAHKLKMISVEEDSFAGYGGTHL